MIALILSAFVALLQPAPPASDEQLETGRDRVDRLTVAVRVNRAGPFAFVVDTAADRSVLSARLAGLLALPAARPVTLHGIAGPEVVPTVRIADLAVGAGRGIPVIAPALPQGGLGADGLLGIDALADRRVTIDFRANRMALAPSALRPPRDPPGTIVVTARRRFGQLILTAATIGGRRVFAVIDTGAENSVANLAMRRRMLGRRTTLGQPGLLMGVTGRTVTADIAVLPELAIGGLRIRNATVAFADIHSFRRFGLIDAPSILIGMDILRAFDQVTIDFGRRSIRFALPRDAARGSAL